MGLTDVSNSAAKIWCYDSQIGSTRCVMVVYCKPSIELYITIEDILDSVAHRIELQDDAPDTW